MPYDKRNNAGTAPQKRSSAAGRGTRTTDSRKTGSYAPRGNSPRLQSEYKGKETRSRGTGIRSSGYQRKETRSGETAPRTAEYRTKQSAPMEESYREYEYKVPETPLREERTTQDSEYILTGRNPIREALKNHHDLEKLLVQKGELSGSAREIVQKAKEQKVQIQVVEKTRLDAIAPNHQGLIAFASAYQYSTVEEILSCAEEKGEKPFLIVMDGITDPHNLGAVIRTAECTGVHGIIIPQHRSVGLSPAAVKSSAGAVEYVKVARVGNLARTIEQLQKENNIWFYAVTMNGDDYRKTDFQGGVGLVIGAEEDGISRLVAEKCDYAVSLPMKGRIESLNASVAAGIMMYRVMECRG